MRTTQTRQVTNAFLADMVEREDRAVALKFSRKPLPNVRAVPYVPVPPFRYASPVEIFWRLLGLAFVGATAVGTGYALMALIVRGWR